MAEINTKFASVLTEMKRSKLGGKKFLRDMPWYVIIGPPGSGKGLHVAIKILRSSGPRAERAAKRFAREQQITMALRHPNIVCCYDIGVWEGSLYIVSEFVPGGDALKYSSLTSPLQQVLWLGADLFRALGYGHDLGMAHGLAALVDAILQRTDVPRLRLSSVEPWDVNDPLLRLWESPRLCRQLHVPLQSGSDTVLKWMGRRINTAQFTALVDAARAVSPHIAITTDVIVGFPGETEADFAATMALIEAIGFDQSFSFIYSPRPGTPAAALADPVPEEEKLRRLAVLQAKITAHAQSISRDMIGTVQRVLVERPSRKNPQRGSAGSL